MSFRSLLRLLPALLLLVAGLTFVNCSSDEPCSDGFGRAADGNCYPISGDDDDAANDDDAGHGDDDDAANDDDAGHGDDDDDATTPDPHGGDDDDSASA